MCGRYRLDPLWIANEKLDLLRLGIRDPESELWDGSVEVFPRTYQPVIRQDEDGKTFVDRRRWGFHRTWPDPAKPDKWVKRELINAVGATVHKLPTFRKAFKETRCLIPMSAWWEWPVLEGVKTRVDISMKATNVFLAAGLYEVSKDNKTGETVNTFTMVTTEPNDFLGTTHDRAPLVLEPEDWAKWLAGGDEALSVIHQHPDSSAFQWVASGDPQKHAN